MLIILLWNLIISTQNYFIKNFVMDITKLSAYDYILPKEFIAQKAHKPADKCKLLYCKIKNNNIVLKDLVFKDILNLISKNDVLFFNNSKVIKARIIGDYWWFVKWLSEDHKNLHKADKVKFFIIKNWQEKECKNCEILFLSKINENNIWEIQMKSDKEKIKNRYTKVVSQYKKTYSEINSKWQNHQISVFEALVKPGKKLKPWVKVKILADKEYWFEIIDYTPNGRIIKYLWEDDIFDVLEKIWKIPLPPYIRYSKKKEKTYQPIQARKAGSVAASTASLHFTTRLFKKLNQKWVKILESTLHIWIWTFKTVDVEDITNYDIHQEKVEIPLNIFEEIWNLKQQWKNIIAVGTTVTRILESLPYLYKVLQKINSEDYQKIKNLFFENLVKSISQDEVKKFIPSKPVISNWQISFYTKLYIYPGFKYKLIDKLITNFHLPKSSLLMLVAAFMWYENMKIAYQHAIKNNYKFFSFGDAMFIEK